ncbi:hypothetical protein LCGC14_1143550 [marine sediment metagenome]|uniref:Uncharacterized protein n=1 Tax=marine sediment metagenome TaxID=412755 RepID=A0A0F9Q3C1_9ZZZZ
MVKGSKVGINGNLYMRTRRIAMLNYDKAPMACWGSKEKVEKWLK